MLDPYGNHGYHRGFCGRKVRPLTEKLSRLLAATAMCALAAACSQIPVDPDSGPANSGKTSPAAESAVSTPTAQPGSTVGVAAGAETTGAVPANVFSPLAAPGSGATGICEHAAMSAHIAVAASSLLSFSLKGLAFRLQKPRWYPWFPYGSSKWAIQNDFLPEIGGATHA